MSPQLGRTESRGDSWMLTHHEFISLPQDIRKSYLKALQGVFLKMSEKSRTPSSDNKSPTQLQEDRQKRKAEYAKSLGMSLDDYKEMIEDVVLSPNRPKDWWKIPEYQEPYRIYKAGLNFIAQSEAEEEWNQRLKDLEMERKKWHDEQNRNRKADEIRGQRENEKFQKEIRLSKSDRKKIRQAEALEEKKQTSLSQTELAKLKNQQTDRLKDIQTTRKPPVCMFAGWVIEEGPCVGPQKIPQWLKFKGVDSEKLVCPKNRFLCNPILFGLKSPAECESSVYYQNCESRLEPFCASLNGGQPTKECFEISKSSLNVAVELVSETDPGIFERFRNQFFRLCDPELLSQNHRWSEEGKKHQAKDDIRKTCAVAEDRLLDLRILYLEFLPRAKAPSGAPTRVQK